MHHVFQPRGGSRPSPLSRASPEDGATSTTAAATATARHVAIVAELEVSTKNGAAAASKLVPVGKTVNLVASYLYLQGDYARPPLDLDLVVQHPSLTLRLPLPA